MEKPGGKSVSVLPSLGEASSPSFQRRCLYLFAGVERPVSFTEICGRHGWQAREVDVVRDAVLQDLLNDDLFDELLSAAHNREFGSALIAIPCHTWSVARFRTKRKRGSRRHTARHAERHTRPHTRQCPPGRVAPAVPV